MITHSHVIRREVTTHAERQQHIAQNAKHVDLTVKGSAWETLTISTQRKQELMQKTLCKHKQQNICSTDNPVF